MKIGKGIKPYKPRDRKYKVIPPFDRFIWKFKVDLKTGCWIWTGSYTGSGYGQLFLYKEKGTNRNFVILAHRYSYLMLKGPIPSNKVLDHICRNPGCINPDHLRAVTQRENTLLGLGPAADLASRMTCVRGHPFTIENTYVWRETVRKCRACGRIRQAEYLKRKAERLNTNHPM